MKTLVIYDSNFGNTEQIARSIAGALNAEAKHIASVVPGDLQGLELLVAGSPINAWNATPAMNAFIRNMPSLSGVHVAAFDTRIRVFYSGNAARKIANRLVRKGGTCIAEPQGFYVNGKEGPLADGETERAKAWVNSLKQPYDPVNRGKNPVRTFTGLLLLFMALNAFAGGWYGLAGAKDVPVEWLEGSPFKSYFIPGLFLFAVIGGSCLVTAVALLRGTTWSARAGIACGILLTGWIVVQLSVIGYVSWMQPAVLLSGIAIAALSRISRRAHR